MVCRYTKSLDGLEMGRLMVYKKMLITFEGGEGSGKTTQIKLFAESLRRIGYDVVETRDPGGTTIGDEIRRILLDTTNGLMSEITEMMLYNASRAQVIDEVILPNLLARKIVLCDRFYDSTYAYQGYGRGIDMDMLRTITGLATNGLSPHLTFMLDIPVKTGLARRKKSKEINRMDLQTEAFHQRVRSGYYKLAKQEPKRWVIVDADQSIEAVHNELMMQWKERKMRILS